jgi:hypothetical protein
MEQWRDVISYIGLYQVSDDGRVRSLVRLTAEATASGTRKPKQLLKPGKNNQGRWQVTLCKDSVTQRFLVHRLVLEAFSGACPDGLSGLHANGDYADNRISNLRWGTHADAIQTAATCRQALRGERSGKSSLTDQDVRDIRLSRDTNRVLGARYSVSNVTVHAIRTRKTWKHV